MELRLSRVRGFLRTSTAPAQAEADPATQLAKLADLVERGFLERSECDDLKRRLLDSA